MLHEEVVAAEYLSKEQVVSSGLVFKCFVFQVLKKVKFGFEGGFLKLKKKKY